MNRSLWNERQQRLAPFVFLAPALAMFTLFVLWPIVQSLWISLHEWDGLGEPVWVGLRNYLELLDDDLFYVSLENNLLWLMFYLLALPAGLAVALFLNQTVAGIASTSRSSFSRSC